jgi:hypothetical protein
VRSLGKEFSAKLAQSIFEFPGAPKSALVTPEVDRLETDVKKSGKKRKSMKQFLPNKIIKPPGKKRNNCGRPFSCESAEQNF